MKNLIKLFLLLTVVGFTLASCEGPMGMAGLDGQDGIDGIDGKDGKDVLPVCLKCHSAANWTAKESQFEMSDKGERGARTDQYCARCHTTEGFHEIVKMGSFDPRAALTNGTKHGCTTCHKHSTFEFSGDTVSQVLFTIAPVYNNFENYDTASLSYKKTTANDYGSINNLCANCHQYRGHRYEAYSDTASATKAEFEEFTEIPLWPIKNTVAGNENEPVQYRDGTNISIHEGANQADYLIGKNGYEFTGATYTRTWQHSGAKCTDCHFNEYNSTTNTGGHTMVVNKSDATCVGCHDIAAKRAITLNAVNAKLAELATLLSTRKVFKGTSPLPSHDFYGTLLPTTASTDLFAGLTRAYRVDPSNGELVYNEDVTWKTNSDFANRIGRDWTYGELGAAWNYTYVNSVASSGNKAVHNPTYAMQLLQTSIDWLTANPPN